MVTEFSDATGKVYTLLNATLPDLVKSTVDYNGGTLGDYRENRVSRAARDDGLTVIEAWLLATETYGREAVEHVRNHLKLATTWGVGTRWAAADSGGAPVVVGSGGGGEGGGSSGGGHLSQPPPQPQQERVTRVRKAGRIHCPPCAHARLRHMVSARAEQRHRHATVERPDGATGRRSRPPTH